MIAAERESLPPSLPALVDLRAAQFEGDALVFPSERATFPAFADAVMTMARRLWAAGIRRGDRVGLLLPASVDGYALILGAMRLGAVPVPVNTRYKARELAYVVRHAGLRLLIAEPAFDAVVQEAGAAEVCRIVPGARDGTFVVAGEAVDPAELQRTCPEPSSDDDAIMLYTSGTASNPKGCVHDHAALIAEGELFSERLRMTSDDCFWTPLPFFHIGGIAALAGTLTAGCASCQMPHFEPTAALDLLESERCTIAFSAFETIWLGILNHPRFEDADLSALRLVINAGTPGSLRLMQERLPRVPQISCFGSTESCAFACLGNADDPLEKRVTTSGVPLRGVEIRTIDESGGDVGHGQVGELLMRGPTRFVRYHDDPDETARSIDDDGWFHSGDLGRIDEHGRVSFVGRLKDMLKVGGENVAAADVESFLLTHPAVEIVQVVGAPDARYIEVAAAFVQLRAGAEASEQELIDFCLGKIATFKVPRYVRFVDEWPMSDTKIQKFRLRERIAAELEQAGIREAQKISAPR